MIQRRQLTICREGWSYLTVLVFVMIGALLRDINLLIILAGMMLGPILYNLRSAVLALRGVRVERKLPEAVCAGDVFSVGIKLHNPRSRRRIRGVLVQDEIRRVDRKAAGTKARADVLFAQVPAKKARQASYRGRLADRGRYRFGPLRVSTRFPLGLVRRTIVFDHSAELVVLPRMGRLTPTWNRLQYEALVGAQQIRRKQGSVEGDFVSMRDWREGDSRRWIHWRTSARRGSLVVRQFEQQQNNDLLLIVDLWQPNSEAAATESAISFAATAVADLCRRGNGRLALVIASDSPRQIRGVASSMLLGEALEALAMAQPTPHGDDIYPLLADSLAELRADGTLVIVGPRRIDLAAARKHQLLDESTRRLDTRRITMLDTTDASFGEYFQIDSEKSADHAHG